MNMLLLAVVLLLGLARRRSRVEHCDRRKYCLTRQQKKAQKYERRRNGLKRKRRRAASSCEAAAESNDVALDRRGGQPTRAAPRDARGRKLTRAQRRASSGLDDAVLESRGGAIRVVVDLALGSAANDARECRSLAKQLAQAYSHMRRVASGAGTSDTSRLVCMELSSYEPGSAVGTELLKMGVGSWVLTKHSRHFTEVYNPRDFDIVYLSPDAPHVLQQLRPGCVYVVGGRVDRALQRFESLTAADSVSVHAARLPLELASAAIRGDTRTALNVDTVIKILSSVAQGQSWASALQNQLPRRVTKVTTETLPCQLRPDRAGATTKSQEPSTEGA
jgi:hypothetical protein